jgi:hypothetical protein
MGDVCLPKDFGGLGINTKLMNEALLLEWLWKILQNVEEDKCCQLLRAKYLQHKPLMACSGGVGSQFWRGVNKIKHKIQWGMSFTVNNGRETRFWEDVWLLNTHLRLNFPDMRSARRKLVLCMNV